MLLKSIATTIPIYVMTCFRLPKLFYKDINIMFANFWWGQKEGERKQHGISWKHLYEPKANGGMSFWDLEAFNMALLAKQAWHILSKLNSLLARVLKEGTFLITLFLDTSTRNNSSWEWRGLCWSR